MSTNLDLVVEPDGSSADKLVETWLVYAHSLAALGTLFLAVIFGCFNPVKR